MPHLPTEEGDQPIAGIEQHQAVLVISRRCERPFMPAYGVTDPTFGDGFEAVTCSSVVRITASTMSLR